MNLTLDCSAIDLIMESWNNGTFDFSQLYQHSLFKDLLNRAQDFQQRAISSEEYLSELLHIDNIDMRQHHAEIARNLRYINEVDLDKICKDVADFLPTDVVKKTGNVRIFPFIGIAGLAADDYIVIDPSPCPWFPDDGSNRERYLEMHILPTLRHELHHVGYSHIRKSPPLDVIKTLHELSVDFALQIQMESGAILCQERKSAATYSEVQMQQMRRMLKWSKEIIDGWEKRGIHPVDDSALETYFSLWEVDKPVYWLGEMICSLLIQKGITQSVGECMLMDPVAMLNTAYGIIEQE